MKALTLHPKWAEKVASGEKTLEVRGWGTGYRGPLAIISGKARTKADKDRRCGEVVAVAALIGVRQATPEDSEAACCPVTPADLVWQLGSVAVVRPGAWPTTGFQGLRHIEVPAAYSYLDYKGAVVKVAHPGKKQRKSDFLAYLERLERQFGPPVRM